MLTSLLVLASLTVSDCPFVYPAGTPVPDAPRARLVVLDGRMYRCPIPPQDSDAAQPSVWKLEHVKPEQIRRIEVMKPERAKELFGDWGSEGAIFIVTKGQVEP